VHTSIDSPEPSLLIASGKNHNALWHKIVKVVLIAG
jgi:hypothetical protein